MNNPILIPFKAEHLLELQSRDLPLIDTYENMISKERLGPAFSASLNGTIIGCAGMALGEGIIKGTGFAWAVVGEKMTPYPLWMTRMIRNGFRDIVKSFNLHRVEMVVLADNQRNHNLAMYLGFVPEGGRAHKYTVTKHDVIRYEFIVGD